MRRYRWQTCSGWNDERSRPSRGPWRERNWLGKPSSPREGRFQRRSAPLCLCPQASGSLKFARIIMEADFSSAINTVDAYNLMQQVVEGVEADENSWNCR